VLAIDETTAHIIAPAGQAGELVAWLRGQGIAFQFRSGAGPAGLDLIDFGNPRPAQERRIRAAFAAWLAGRRHSMNWGNG
jgi:hypothetical protein